ncbi:Transcriptional regulator, GntR family [Leifsonia rubra CMS 76R]|nr:Transcriptional regulator, GntR family [Leifsonia rubra CMS 76R]
MPTAHTSIDTPATPLPTTAGASTWAVTLPALERPTKRYRISDAVYEQLSESIRNLKLPPGAPISEPAIASWLQVSRSPVREAFTRLVDLGLITVIPQVGSHIAAISMREVEEAVFIRQALETSAFQRAIHAGVPDTTEIQRLVDANREAANAGDLEAFFNTDEQLHQNVFVLAGLPRLWDLVRGTKMQLDRLRRLNLATAIVNPTPVAEHQSLVDALNSRDEAAGVAVIAQHATRIFFTVEQHRTANPSYFAP